MNNFEIKARIQDLRDEDIDALYDAGCDDATVSTHGQGNLIVAFAREGDLADAVASGIRDVRTALPHAVLERIDLLPAV